MKIVLARDFGSIYDEVCSPGASFGAPGTENQTYLHAKHLRELGCDVYVLGNMARDIEADGVKYLGLDGPVEARNFIRGMVPDVVIAEGGQFFLKVFGPKLDSQLKDKLKNTCFLQVMHNGPQWNSHVKPGYIDYWCYVCESQKFFHKLYPSFDLFNAPFFESVHSKTTDCKRDMQIVIAGAPTKPGVIEAINVIRKLQKDYDFKAVFLMPQWSSDSKKFIDLQNRCTDTRFENINMRNLSKLLKESLVVISSFNPGEQCPLMILDSYATGTLCITGSSGSLRYLNPAGIRCNTGDLDDVLRWAIGNPDKCVELGKRGLSHLKQSGPTESAQKEQLKHMVEHLEDHKKPGCLQRRCGRILFRVDKRLRISKARRVFSDFEFAFRHKSWRSDVD